MGHEWVKCNYCVGFVTTKGLMLDLDDVVLRKAINIGDSLLEKHKLEGYILIKSSENHYHLVFNRYLTWRKIVQIIFNQYVCIRWGIWQARKGELTLRVSAKNNKNIPVIIYEKGKSDKLINEYKQVYDMVNKENENRKGN